MFGIGGSEILVILVVALLFLGPDKLPDAAKHISKGIRDLKKQSRALQQTIENDEYIGGAIRDLKSALRGEDPPVRYNPPIIPPSADQPHDETAEPTCEVPHFVDDPHHAITEPQFVGEAGEVATGEVATLADHEPELIKPPAGETAARTAPAQDSDPATHKHG